MALQRIWTPSGNYSGGGTKRLIVIHTMEGFTGPNGAYDCAKYFQGNVGASSQVCIDNNRGKVWEGVSRGNASWTQCNYNGAAVSCEQSGYASWSRQYWLDNRDAQLHNIADWIAEESRALGIPITDLTSSQAQGSGRGVCYHSELGSSGCGHSDPGGGWPIDKVLEWARGGGGGTTPPPSGGSAPALHVDYFGTDHNSTCGDVQPWQQKMYDRGWHEMLVDGDYGPISKDICLAFQREKGLSVDGYVGPETWNATWEAPVT
jgi:peptidoglycan hydrolase-like protein with peptidoglycan-binding domain